MADLQNKIQAFNHLDKADTFEVDRAVADADPSAYDGLVLPGGVANPDFMCMDAEGRHEGQRAGTVGAQA